jgi:hypothetical protein
MTMTRAEYEAAYPLGSVNIQDGDTIRPMDDAEWTAWVDETWNASNPTVEEVDAARLAAYQTTSDPLFFEWQRGDGTEQAWLDAVAAVKAANPYPPAP